VRVDVDAFDAYVYGELNGIDDAAFVYQMGMEYI
jgi:hypothetical protein